MAGRAHFAAPLLLAVVVALILYVSLWPFSFGADGPGVLETLRQLTWARAGRSDLFNNVLLYVPLGFCIALVVEPRLGRAGALAAGVVCGALLSLAVEVAQASITLRVPSLTDLSLNAAGSLAGAFARQRVARARRAHDAARQSDRPLGCGGADGAGAVADRAAVATVARCQPAAGQACGAAAAHAGTALGRAGRVLRRLAGGGTGRVPPRAAAAQRRRLPAGDRGGAGGTHVHRRQYAGVRGTGGHRAAAAGAGAAEPGRGPGPLRTDRGGARQLAGCSRAAAGARRRAPGHARGAGGRRVPEPAVRRRPRSSPARASATWRWRGCWPARDCIHTWRPG